MDNRHNIHVHLTIVKEVRDIILALVVLLTGRAAASADTYSRADLVCARALPARAGAKHRPAVLLLWQAFPVSVRHEAFVVRDSLAAYVCAEAFAARAGANYRRAVLFPW